MKSKHIDIRYHFVRKCYQDNHIVPEYVPSSNNIADMFTKPPKMAYVKKKTNRQVGVFGVALSIYIIIYANL